MSQIDFSIVIPSRERPYLLKDCLTHIAKNTSKLESIEGIVVIDADDTVTDMFVPDFERDFPFTKFYRIERLFNVQNNFNYGYSKSSGHYYFGVNDDAMMDTDGWDDIARDRLRLAEQEFGDDILYGCTDTDSKNKGDSYAEMPIMSRSGIDALGYAVNPKYPEWGADVELARIYTEIGRVVDLKDIKLRHVHHSGEKEYDHIRYEMEQRFGNSPRDYFTCDISMEVEKLKSAIDARRACWLNIHH